MNGALSNGDLGDELKEEKLPKRIPKEPVTTTVNDQPGTSPKKKKLALSDLEDTTVVKNFIANDEISESDEDDSEDETFEPTNELVLIFAYSLSPHPESGFLCHRHY